MNDAAPPTLAPVAPATRARSTPAPVVLAAVVLAAVVAVGATLAAIRRPAGPSGPAAPAEVSTRFGPGTFARVEALRDRAVRGLLALRRPEGDFTTRPGGGVDPAERREATAMGVLGLAAARRMGSQVDGLAKAIADARAILFRAPARGALATSNRSLKISTISAALLGLSIGGDPTDRKRVEATTTPLLLLTEPGPPIQGWPQGIASRAFAEILETGHAEWLGPEPYAVVPVWNNLGDTRDTADQRVSEALAQAIRSPAEPSRVASEIFAKVLEDSIAWYGEQTDLGRWALRSWLAARVPGGDAWFARVLPLLEQAVGPDGAIEGEMYGYPVQEARASSSSCGRAWTCARRRRGRARPARRPDAVGRGRHAAVNLSARAPLDLAARPPYNAPLAGVFHPGTSLAGRRAANRRRPRPTEPNSGATTMAREERTDRRRAFIDQPADFNEQMYHALKSAPWWMISIAFHVLLVVISSAFQSSESRLGALRP